MINKSVADNSQGSHNDQLDAATDWQTAAWRDNVINITLRQVYWSMDFKVMF